MHFGHTKSALRPTIAVIAGSKAGNQQINLLVEYTLALL